MGYAKVVLLSAYDKSEMSSVFHLALYGLHHNSQVEKKFPPIICCRATAKLEIVNFNFYYRFFAEGEAKRKAFNEFLDPFPSEKPKL